MDSYKLNTIEEALADFKEGKFVIVVDDEDRENEGDFITAAETITPEKVNFMMRYGRGVLCTPISEEVASRLELDMQVHDNTSLHETPFTVTVDLIGHGCTTGVSMYDRAQTILALADPKTQPTDLARPGHVNPLRARSRGVLRRAGHTEAAIDLARLSGMQPVAALIEIINEDGTITTKTNTGDMVTCNLNSISLGRITDEELEENIALQIRMLDNVISINQAPVPESRMTSDKYRAIGLGTSGYHHYLVNHDIQWESDEHIEAADKLFENIAYYAIKASMELAKEKGAYPAFKGSEWETGEYFTRRGYTSDRWKQLAADVAKYGIRNGYLMAVAPTGSTSNIANTTAGIDPIFKKFFIEEKKGSFTPKTAPDLSNETMWFYKEAHTIDQQWSIKACGIRQRHIDQAQSFNLYITPQMKAKEILDLYVEAYKQGIKTIYYIRNQSLEMDECTSCSS